jgi:ribosome-associated protein
MTNSVLQDRNFSGEMQFSASRSSGAGGQNVNKVNTKVELRFNVMNSQLLNESEKQIITEKLANQINQEGELLLVSQTERSQLKNKEEVILRFYALLTKALTPRKKRRPTKPTKASKEKRLERKRNQSEKKANRKGFAF